MITRFRQIIGKPLFLILESREVNITFQRLLWDDLTYSLKEAYYQINVI